MVNSHRENGQQGNGHTNRYPSESGPHSPRSVEDRPTAESIQKWLVDQLAHRLELTAGEIDIREPFASYGVGSVQAVELTADLEQWLGRRLSPTLAWEYPNIQTLARYLAEGSPALEMDKLKSQKITRRK